jgi:chemotaxis response regulator CheB
VRIGIVNDMRLAREALRRVVDGSPGDEVAWLAADGEEAIERAAADPPDLILMDLIMPRVDGAEATRRIMARGRCPILIVTSSVSGNISKVYEAMGHGALDAVDTPVLGGEGGRGPETLLRKIRRIDRQRHQPGQSGEFRAYAPPASGEFRALGASASSTAEFRRVAAPTFVAIGASTGGPKVLAEVLGLLPPTLDVPVVIAQHVDPAFATGMAAWLAGICPLPVQMADPGAEPAPGHVYLARTHEHLVLNPRGRFEYTPEPASCHYRPSVDALFGSLARHGSAAGMAALLTGMGRDGAAGLLALRKKGWVTAAQDQASCTVYGMPKAAAELNAASQVLDPFAIGRLIAGSCPRRPG